ncbi:tRNA pseudouridine(55) synthase TruB [Candidatus Synechococcus calcipolaris]|uniref:tRNA pseudouridine(55) synthase TruB n=1 Tax=Candidatus Synechococcus calcipolaris TaxID=1522304 RepID=UPI0030CA17A2
MLGFLNLAKPMGLTSHDCVAQLRRRLKIKRIGHGGTLDPMATGVLPIALGPATRLLPYLPPEKAYIGRIRFGLSTDTDDVTGHILNQQSSDHLTLTQIQALLPQFMGHLSQIPPAYSAVQIEGKRLYHLARQGQRIDVPPRQVEIYDLKILDWQPGPNPELTLEIACGPGTYIRSLARDLGALLGVGGTLAALERTLSCGFSLSKSTPLEAVIIDHLPLISPIAALAHLPHIPIGGLQIQDWYQGRSLTLSDSQNQPLNNIASLPPLPLDQDSQPCLISRQPEGHCLGLGILKDSVLLPKIVFPDAN